MRRMIPKISLVALALVTTTANWAHAQVATALTSSNSLVTFAVTNPGSILTTNVVTGLTAGDVLVGIDFRPIDQQLIGFGYNSATGIGRVYSITSAGVATSINANSLSIGTNLNRVIADFNPFANAFRMTTTAATQNNARIPTGGTGALTFDTDLNPANSGIRATAYSRNNAGGGTSGATTLYLIDGVTNALLSQGTIDFFSGSGTSPNTGTLTTVASLSGVLGLNVVGFDIFSAAGTAAASPGSAYLATSNTFFTLNLNTGAATSVGTIGAGLSIVDITIGSSTVPEPTTLALSAGGLMALLAVARRRRRATA